MTFNLDLRAGGFERKWAKDLDEQVAWLLRGAETPKPPTLSVTLDAKDMAKKIESMTALAVAGGYRPPPPEPTPWTHTVANPRFACIGTVWFTQLCWRPELAILRSPFI